MEAVQWKPKWLIQVNLAKGQVFYRRYSFIVIVNINLLKGSSNWSFRKYFGWKFFWCFIQMPNLDKYKTLANSQFSSPSIRQPPTSHKKILEDISLDRPAILHQRNSIFNINHTLCRHFRRTLININVLESATSQELSLNLMRRKAKLNSINTSL